MPSHASPNDSPSPSILLRPQQIAEHPTVSHWPPAVTWTDQCCGSRHLRHKSKSLWCLRISPTINTPTILYIYYILRIYTWKNSQKGEILRWMSLVSPTTTDPLRHWKRPFSGHLLRTWTGFRSASVAWNWVPKVRKSLRIFFGGEHQILIHGVMVFFLLVDFVAWFFCEKHPGKHIEFDEVFWDQVSAEFSLVFGGHRFLGTPPASWLPGRATSNSAQGSSRGAGAPLRLCKSWERFSCLQKMTRTQEPTYPTKQEKEKK